MSEEDIQKELAEALKRVRELEELTRQLAKRLQAIENIEAAVIVEVGQRRWR